MEIFIFAKNPSTASKLAAKWRQECYRKFTDMDFFTNPVSQ